MEEREFDALVMIAASEHDADLYYVTRFLAPDALAFFDFGGHRALLASDLEFGRAAHQARVDEVLPLATYEARAKERGIERPSLIDAVAIVLEERKARRLLVPASFGLGYAEGLRERGFEVRHRKDPFFAERGVKSQEEVGHIAEAQRATESAMALAIDLIREADVRDGGLTRQGRPLTSEEVRRRVAIHLLERDYVTPETIVAGGDQGCDPHHRGSGPLRAGESIILDIFPRSIRTRYWGDLTRTVVKGRAPDRLKRMYDAVLAAQAKALALVRDGADGRAIHEDVCQVFVAQGFETGSANGKPQGFIHGTGHGVGLEIHEPPRISKAGVPLRAGQVVTIEPGLYYPGVGAIRIEDLVVVTPAGLLNLTSFPKVLEV